MPYYLRFAIHKNYYLSIGIHMPNLKYIFRANILENVGKRFYYWKDVCKFLPYHGKSAYGLNEHTALNFRKLSHSSEIHNNALMHREGLKG